MPKYKTIDFYAKCSDLFHATFTDEEGNEKDVENYPPGFIGHDGVSLKIDLETGQILNWTPPTQEDLKEYILGDDWEDEFNKEYNEQQKKLEAEAQEEFNNTQEFETGSASAFI